jgi:hypothetical protein
MKVDLTKAEKRRIGRPSSPRWEIDIVAYQARNNELLAMECKSFLDSPGVSVSAFLGKREVDETRYKLFFSAVLRRVVLGRLAKQAVAEGRCRARPRVRLGLAAGKIAGDEEALSREFRRRGWVLWGPRLLTGELASLRDSGYEDSVAAIVTKLLLRQRTRAGRS